MRLHFISIVFCASVSVQASEIYLPKLVSNTGISKPVKQHNHERPLAPDCNAEAHTDYGGMAFTLGFGE